MGLFARLSEDPRSFTWLRKIAEANFVAVRRIIRREIDLEHPARTLDLGCGTGELAPIFHRHDYLGLDLSARYVAYARRRHPAVAFAVCDAAAIPLPRASFDNVIVFGVLHHMDDPLARSVVLEIARVLRPGGRFLLLEDRNDVPSWNLAGRLIHTIDAGENIRTLSGYEALVPWDRMREVRRFTFTSGICDYYGFHLETTATDRAV